MRLTNSDKLMDVAAEGAVLSSMIIDHTKIPVVLEYLTASDFFREENQAIFRAVVKQWHKNPGGAVDGVLVRRELEDSGELKDVGGLDYYRAVVESAPTSANARYYAENVLNKARYRKAVAAVQAMYDRVDEGGSVDDVIADIQRIAMGLECDRAQADIFHVSDHICEVAVATQDEPVAIPTGYRDVDDVVTGFSPGDLAIVAARPSMGKTAFAVGVGLNMAKAGKAVLIFTLEMAARALMERLTAMAAGVDLSYIKSGEAPREMLDRYYHASYALAKLPITIAENANTPQRQAAIVQQMQQAGKADVVIVDYIGLMESGRRTSNRVDEVSVISRQMKRMAQRYKVPAIALSQLNRACEGRENHRPRMSDLRDSGSIEQDADFVLFLHREDYYRRLANPGTKDFDGLAEVIVAKNRNGKCDTVRMVFLDIQMRFADYAFGVNNGE